MFVLISGVHELHEGSDECGDRRDDEHKTALESEIVLDEAVPEHEDERGQRVDRIDRAHFRAVESHRVEPALEERPPDAPGAEEQEDAG